MKTDKILIMKYMGFDFGTVGYTSTKSETIFQNIHAEMFERLGVESIGDYFVDTKRDMIVEYEEIDFMTWNDLMPVVDMIRKEAEVIAFEIILSLGVITKVHYGDKWNLNEGNDALKVVYETVVDFIKWHNANPESQGKEPK